MKPSPGDIVLITEDVYTNEVARFPVIALKGSTAVIQSSFVHPIYLDQPDKGMETAYNVRFLTVPTVDENQFTESIECAVGYITSLEERFFQVIERKAEDKDGRQ